MDKRVAKRQAYSIAGQLLREYIASPAMNDVLGPNASAHDQQRLLIALRQLAGEMEERYFRSLKNRGY